MSYILDALRKAEAEKAQGPNANQTVTAMGPRRYHWSQYLIAAALIGNLTVLIWLFGPWSDTPTENELTVEPGNVEAIEPATRSAPAQVDRQAIADVNPTAENNRSATAAQPSQAPAPTDPQPAAVSKPPAAPEPVHTTLAGLSNAARSRFPEVSFSTHVYTSDPESRAVVVNGKRLREGDQLGNLQLTNITETGVVFRFENYFVTLSVLDDWD